MTLLYANSLATADDVAGFILEGDARVSFPEGRLRLESSRPAEEGQASNIVFWCPEVFGDGIEVSWDFHPLHEPGLAIMFFAAAGRAGEDLFDPSLPPRTGPYDQYHSGAINAYHVSYFRRRWPEERRFHTCNLRKSHGFHLVALGADPLPDVTDVDRAYRMRLTLQSGRVTFGIDGLTLLDWTDDASLGPVLSTGRLGLRQMAPLVAEYSALEVHALGR
ncbi:MAG TPA: DUF1961 family protein [Propionibacteriaceae bacterium]|nr:DUF1961 family protein [Propionibacteriaceae bacterium]